MINVYVSTEKKYNLIVILIITHPFSIVLLVYPS